MNYCQEGGLDEASFAAWAEFMVVALPTLDYRYSYGSGNAVCELTDY